METASSTSDPSSSDAPIEPSAAPPTRRPRPQDRPDPRRPVTATALLTRAESPASTSQETSPPSAMGIRYHMKRSKPRSSPLARFLAGRAGNAYQGTLCLPRDHGVRHLSRPMW